MHGKGDMIYSSGNFYQGEWSDNIMHGIGKMNFADGNIYQGDW